MPKKTSGKKATQNTPSNNVEHTPGPAEHLREFMWKPGQSGNPGGRPKNKPLTHLLEKQLTEIVPDDPKKRSYAQLLIESGVKRAITKSDVLFKEIFDRVEGKQATLDERERDNATVKVVILDVPRPPRPAIPVKSGGDD